MTKEWINTTWGEISTLQYGKSLKNYGDLPSAARVFGTNGPIGWHHAALSDGPGLIIGRKGAYRGVHYSSDPFWVIDTAYYLRPKVELDLRWAYYALLDYDVNNIDDGSPIPSTTRDAFYFAPVNFPPLEQQRRIAALLDSLDAKIELNRQMIAALEEMTRALFQSWFVDFDPVHAKAKGRASSLSHEVASLFPDRLGTDGLPVGWHYAPLLSLATWINGAAYKNMDFVGSADGRPVIKIAELKAGITAHTRFTNTDLGDRYRITDGELLF